MTPYYALAVRSPNRPRARWHLLAGTTRTICGKPARGWNTTQRGDLAPDAICANCLRDTP